MNSSLRTYAMYIRVHIRYMHMHDIINMQIFVMKLCPYFHTDQCKRTGGCYNELVVAFFSTGGGVKGKKN